MKKIKELVTYLKENNLILTTAESCTAGRIIHLLSKVSGSGECLDTGYVVYSEEAKKRVLGVKPSTISTHTLTSEAVAREMAEGALRKSDANIVIACTGIAGSKPMDGIPPGTVCFAWGFKDKNKAHYTTETQHFVGRRVQIQNRAAEFALLKLPSFYDQFKI